VSNVATAADPQLKSYCWRTTCANFDSRMLIVGTLLMPATPGNHIEPALAVGVCKSKKQATVVNPAF